MYLDAFIISALVDEFMDALVGGKIQDVLDVDDTGIGMEIYANHRRQYFYASADTNRPRLHITTDKLRRGLQRPTQIGLLLRRYIEGGRVVHVSQPPWERVIHLHIESDDGEFELIMEPMERRSNILLVRDGIIMDCIRRVGPDDNRYRLSLPNHAYQPPPPLTGRREPLSITLNDMDSYFEQVEDPKYKAFQVLTSHVLGLSPLLAREIVYRAMGEPNIKAGDADPEAIFDALQQVATPLMRREWQPGIVQTEDEGIVAFSVYPITYLEGWQPTETVSEAIAAYFGAPVGEDAYNAAKKPVFAIIKDARGKVKGKLESLKRGMKDDAEREVLRKSGELILAYQYVLEKGQTELRAQYDANEPELVIKLDPDLSPLDNAQRYFTRYNKSKRALDDVPGLIEETENELSYLDQLETDLELATNWPDIDDVQGALQAGGYFQGKRAKRIGGGGQSAPIRLVTDDAFVMWIGRNSRQNEIVTFKKASADDFWLHARDVPGAHVIIKNDGRHISEELIEQAASIAAYYSKRRADGRVPVDITRVKYVRKIKGAARGMVTYRNERTLSVEPKSEKLFT